MKRNSSSRRSTSLIWEGADCGVVYLKDGRFLQSLWLLLALCGFAAKLIFVSATLMVFDNIL